LIAIVGILLMRWLMQPLLRLRQRAAALVLELTGKPVAVETSSEVGAVVPDDGSKNRIVPRGGEHDWVTEGFKDFAVEFA
jgi:CBS domain containing-hemolysin-like protein